MKEFNYYIFIDFSENLIGYNIIAQDKMLELLPKISRFRHYKSYKNRKIYLKHIKNYIKKDNIRSYFNKIKIVEIRKGSDLLLDVAEFLKKNRNLSFFISIDNDYYKRFMRMIKIIDGNKIKVFKESELKHGSAEYQLNLVIDNLLNIERRKQKQ